ncbi:MAG: hypothetical protein HGA97_00240 [Chlorobiaceae bacterium]|jgi:uncharacterized protein|nr:hypothetical protein [Chlorobiaceae bacterium]
MKCPACNMTLLVSERSGIEVDYCPECRGVWLDRGELDKIIERTKEHSSERYDNNRYDEEKRHHGDDKHYGHGEHDYHADTKTGKRKRGGGALEFFGGLFD